MRNAEVWAILQIAETADIRAIKRAYAKQLKEDRAHKDTGRFVALRAAYEVALTLAESTIATQDAPSADLQIADTSTQTRLKHEEGDEDQSPLSPAADESILQPHQCPSTEVDSERQPRSRRDAIFRPRVTPEDESDTQWAARRHRQPADEIPRNEGPAKQNIHPLPRENAEDSERKPRQRRKVVFRPQTTPDAESDGQRLPRTFSRRTNAEHGDDMPPLRPVIPTTDDAPEQPASTLQEPLDAAESPEEIELRPRAPRDDLPQLTPITARRQEEETERPPRPVDDTPAIEPLREAFQPLLAEIQLALKNEVDEAKFQALGQRVVAYLGRCGFVQREDAEHQLIQLFVHQHPEHNPLLRILDAEFGWSNDSLGFHQRFPFAPDDLLESLRPAQTQISEPYRRQLIAVLNGSLLAWPFISLFGIKTRRGLEQLLASSETLWEVSPTRLALWQVSFSLLPCISFTTYLLLTLFTAIQLHLLGVFSAAVETFLAAVFLPIAVWGGLRFAWRHTEAEYSNFSRYWPILASIFVLTPGVWHAITWSAGQLTSSPGYASTLFQALTIALTLAIGGFCAFRFANELQRVAATLSARRMTFLTVLLALIGGVYLLPGAEELGFFGKTTLAGLTVMMLFSYMRQWQWRHGIAGVFFVPFMGLAGGALMALTGDNISHITRMCAFTINLVWLAESALRIPRLQSPAVPQKTGAFALAIVGLAATLSPASEAFHHALGFTALLGAECVAPLFSMRWQPGGKKGPELPAAGCLVIVIGLELISLILTARLPGNLSRAGDATTTVLGAMLLTRLLWTALSYQGWPFRKAHQ